nr:MAG TPA: hypothetical protein [Caudoviricetes sp.]
MHKAVNNTEKVKVEIELNGSPPSHPVVLSFELCERVAQALEKGEDKELWRDFARELRRATVDKWGLPKVVLDKIPPYLTVEDVRLRQHVYALMRTRRCTKEDVKKCLRGLPKSEVISRNPIIITKLGFELLKQRLW